jgi:hypothetical protein
MSAESAIPLPARRPEQLTIGQLLVLMGGAAVGMAVYQTARENLATNEGLRFGWIEVVFTCYLALGGVAMVAAVLMLLERWRFRRPWSPPAAALFVVGLLAWCTTPLVASTFLVLGTSYNSRWFDRALCVYEPGTLSLVGFSEVWPVMSLVLLAACAGSGQVSRWWQFRGAWPDWLGMWMLTAWSLPAVHVVYRAITIVPIATELR